MAVTYDAPTFGNEGYPDFETPIGLYWTRWRYPQRSLGNFTMIHFGRTYVQQLGYWNPTALDTEDLYQSGFYLYEETSLELQNPGGLANWTRWYGTIPAAYNTSTYQSVTFPGYYSEYDADKPEEPPPGFESVYRPPLTKVINVREYHQFILSSTPWTTWTEPKNAIQLQTPAKAYVSYVDDTTLVNNGGLVGGDNLTYSNYQEKIAGTGGFDAEIVVKDPVVKRAYGAGNIWELITYYATAE